MIPGNAIFEGAWKRVIPLQRPLRALSLQLRRVSSMIDFQNASYVKLSQVDLGHVADQINPLLIEGEQAFVAYKGMRDYVVFTSKRIIAVNVQGITGKKKDFTSLPWPKSKPFRWRPQALLTWTPSLSCGSRAWAR